jgi:hypothetical protein
MFDLGPASFYFSGGITFFRAEKTRIISGKILDKDKKISKVFY